MTDIDTGFCGEDFCTSDYLVPMVTSYNGVQFMGMLVDKEKDLGAQFQGVIAKQTNLSTQFQGVLAKETDVLTQFRALINARDNLRTQFNGVIQARRNLPTQFQGIIAASTRARTQFNGIIRGETRARAQFQAVIADSANQPMQFLGIINDSMALNTQFASIQGTILNAQFTSVIYNTELLRVMSEFPSRGLDGLNWTATSTQAGDFSVNNLNTDIVEQYWRSATGVTSATVSCDTQINQGVFMDTFAILGHNFSRSANVVIQGSVSASFSPVGTTIAPTYEIDNIYYISPDFPTTGYRYWRVIVDDPTNPDGFVRIGTILFGNTRIMTRDCFTNPVQFGLRQYVDSVFTEGHTNVRNDRGRKRYVTLEFRDMNYNRGDYKLLRDLQNTASTVLKCLWIPTPKYPSRFAVFGKITELPTEAHTDVGQLHDYVTLSLTVDESL